MSANINNLTPRELAQLQEKSKDLLIIDVRSRDEVRSEGAIPRTINVPVNVLEGRHLPEELDTQLIFSCASGGRSFRAAQTAINMGFKNVFNLEGGLSAWKRNGLPVQKFLADHVTVKTVFDNVTGTGQYIVTDDLTKETAIIDSVLDYDPASGQVSYENATHILEYVKKWGLKVTHIMETHVHADHLTASLYLKHRLGNKPKICISHNVTKVQAHFQRVYNLPEVFQKTGAQFDVLFKDNEEFKLGTLTGKVIPTPGHTPDSVTYWIGDTLFTGDSLFMPDIGTARCDFPGGSAKNLYDSIYRLYTLPDGLKVFVGHDYPPESRMPAVQTTLEHQKRKNIHMQASTSEEAFVETRTKRDKTLQAPRLLYPSIQVNIRCGRLPAKEQGANTSFLKIPVRGVDEALIADV